MHIDGLVICSGTQTGNALNWPIGGSVNRIAVQREPIPDGPQPLLELRLDLAVRLGADIQQKIAAAAGYLNQAPDQRLFRLEIEVVLVIGPRVVDGHAGFPQPEVLRPRDRILQLFGYLWVNAG